MARTATADFAGRLSGFAGKASGFAGAASRLAGEASAFAGKASGSAGKASGFAGRMDGHGADHAARLARLRRLAATLDAAIRLPGGFRIGADGMIGLVPGVGDAITALLGAYIVYEARRLGLPRHKIARMVGNLAFDAVVGAVPVVGDVFDFFVKANLRNMRIIEEHFAAR